MKMIKILLLSLLIFVSTVFAQKGEETVFETEVSGIGTSAFSFLEIGMGARAMGMGSAYTAVSNDVASLYWNPAGAVWASSFQMEASHNEWFLDSKMEFLGALVPVPNLNSAIGFSFSTLGFGDQAVRTVNRPEGTGETYSARDISFGITWATALTDRFSFGVTGKYLSSRIWHETASAFAVDLGIFYNTALDGLRLGFSMSNFGTKVKYDGMDLDTSVDPDEDVQNFDRVPASYNTSSYSLPLLFRAGVAYDFEVGNLLTTLISADLLHPSTGPEAVNIGAELGFMNMFFVRGGYQSLFDDSAESGLTVGAGIDYYNKSSNFGIRFDYSWSEWGLLSDAQRFSVGLVF